MNTYLTPEERILLEGAVVGIAGAGGLGSNVAMHLVRCGVRNIIFADFDVVSESNLNRQFFFRDQLGMTKVEALKQNLLRINPEASLTAVKARLDEHNIKALFASAGIIVEAFDNVESKSMLLRAFIGSGRKVVTASGIAGWGKSNDIRLRTLGRDIIAVGDATSSIASAAPNSARVGIAAAMQANAVLALILNQDL